MPDQPVESRRQGSVNGGQIRRIFLQDRGHSLGGGVPLKGPNWDFSLDPARAYGRDEIWDAVCRAARAWVSRVTGSGLGPITGELIAW